MPKKSTKTISAAVIHTIALELAAYKATISIDGIRKAKDKFMDLYQQCEFAYKQLLINYKVEIEGMVADTSFKARKGVKSNKFNPDNLIIVDSQVEKVLTYAGIKLNKMLFCTEASYSVDGNKSCRKLRNEITHSSSKKAIQEVFDRQKNLFYVMRSFLNKFK